MCKTEIKYIVNWDDHDWREFMDEESALSHIDYLRRSKDWVHEETEEFMVVKQTREVLHIFHGGKDE